MELVDVSRVKFYIDSPLIKLLLKYGFLGCNYLLNKYIWWILYLIGSAASDILAIMALPEALVLPPTPLFWLLEN